VLADEPTANLDTRTGASIIELMHDVQAKFNTTFIFSTHDAQVMSHSDRTFSVRDGRLVSQTAGAPT
jgi:putative ABC transport system ATP-binding protein